MSKPPLKLLHSEKNIIQLKLHKSRKLETQILIDSLRLGQEQPLTVKPDGTVMEGNHRLIILQERGIDINALPCDILEEDS
jgi:hypothetical protein